MPGGGIPIGAPRPGGIPIGGPIGSLMPGGGPIIPGDRRRVLLWDGHFKNVNDNNVHFPAKGGGVLQWFLFR